jgi:hypothetical protein
MVGFAVAEVGFSAAIADDPKMRAEMAIIVAESFIVTSWVSCKVPANGRSRSDD